MNELLGLSVVAAFVSAGFAFWSASNAERLKDRFQRGQEELKGAFQQKLELLKLDSDRIKSNHTLQIAKEYLIYEDVYPNLLKTYYAFSGTVRLDEAPTIVEEILHTEAETKAIRSENLEKAQKGLGFLNEVVAKKPFIPTSVYIEIEKYKQMCIDTYFSRAFPVLRQPLDGSDKCPEHTNHEFKQQLDAICNAIKNRLRVVEA